MKWWLKTIIAIVAVIVIVFLGMSVYLGYTATRVERINIEETLGADHVQAYNTNPEEYIERIVTFFNEALQ
jgi:hypothetical protein